MGNKEDLQTAVDNVHLSLIDQTETIIDALSTRDDITRPGSRWVEYANQLLRLVPDYAMPNWLPAACSEFGTDLVHNTRTLNSLARFVTREAPSIAKKIIVGDAAMLDLEQLFAEQSQRFDLNQVFENLVARLSELIAADVVDYRIVNDSLNRLNALFKRTRNGTLSTVLLTMNFGRFFLRSFGGVLKANKYTKPIIESFEKEFDEASKIVQQAEEETKKEMVQRLIQRQRMELFLEANPDLKDTVAGFLPAPVEGEERNKAVVHQVAPPTQG